MIMQLTIISLIAISLMILLVQCHQLIKLKKEKNEFEENKFAVTLVSTKNDYNKVLGQIIDDRTSTYVLMHPELYNSVMSDSTQRKMAIDIASDIVKTMSQSLFNYLSLFINPESIEGYITEKVMLQVIQYAINNGSDMQEYSK